VVELFLGEASLEEGARVDARRRVPLEEDLVARRLVTATEEVVEPDLVEARRAGVGRQVPADPFESRVGTQDHREGVPADHAPDPQLHRLVTREVRLLLGADGVDVSGLG